MEQLIHKPTGELVDIDPFVVAGNKMRLIKPCSTLPELQVGAIGEINEACARAAKKWKERNIGSRRRRCVYAMWKMYGENVEGPYYVYADTVEIIDGNTNS